MKRPLTVLLWLTLSACATAGTPTPDPLAIFVGADSSLKTAQAAQATADYFGQQLTATLQARRALATERAWSIQETQAALQITATARAWEATAAAERAMATSTAAAAQTAQALSVAATQSALSATAEANVANARAYATAMAAQAESVNLAMERGRMTNAWKAVLPWTAAAVTFSLAIFLLYHRGKILIVPKDERGDARLIGNVVDGTVLDPDKQFHPLGGLLRCDLLLPPGAEQQAAVTGRDQLVDLATRPGGDDGERRRLAARQITDGHPKATRPASVTIVAPEQIRPVVQDVVPPMLMDAVEGEAYE